jgi:hypothetical protein
VLAELAIYRRYVAGLRDFLSLTETIADGRRRIQAQLARRDESFLALLEGAVFSSPRSPYAALLRHAGAQRGDIYALVREHGVDGALQSLHAEGVYVTLEEFKGRQPIRRGELELAVTPADFDNPLTVGHFRGRSGGSRGAGRAILVDFARIAYDSAHHGAFLDAFGLTDRPTAVWYPNPPVITGLLNVLHNARLGRRVDRWFSQSGIMAGASAKPALLLAAAWSTSRAVRRPLPFPWHVPPGDAVQVARWLAAVRKRGEQGLVQCTPSSGVRVCGAAREHGIDVGGSFFRFGGEPYTTAKCQIVAAAGCRAACNYYMTEAGVLGTACAAADAVDDVHVALDKAAVLERTRELGDGSSVSALFFTTLHPATAKVMVNVENGDFGVVERRTCGCSVGELGLDLHMHTIRSFEKLTSEGTNFLGADLVALVEEILPQRFGGAATDYQLVEAEREGLARVQVLVSPRVGPVDERAVRDAVLGFLRTAGGSREVMARAWASSDTLEVVRREPYVTAASKILPLHVLERS